MNKLEKIEIEARKTRERIAAMNAQLRQIEGQRTEQENLQIIQQVRALNLSREELYTFLDSGELPAAPSTAPVKAAETIHSRKARQRPAEQPAETPEIDVETAADNESGVENNEG